MSVSPLLPENKIWIRLSELGESIREYYANESIIVLCVLKGSIIFTADLVRKLSSNVEIEFVQSSSYGAGTAPGNKPKFSGLESLNISQRRVLLIDDILDTGNTLYYLNQELQDLGAAEVKYCVLLNKQDRRAKDIQADWVGFEIEDQFVVGYGLDYNGKYRNLPYIGTWSAEEA